MSEKKYSYLVEQWNKFEIKIENKENIDNCFKSYIDKINSEEDNNKLKLEEYTNRINDDATECDYFCTFIENKSSKLYGSASAGTATYFGIKKNDDENTYYISKKIHGTKEFKNASREVAQDKFKNILDNLKALVKDKITDENKYDIFDKVEINNKITSKVMLKKIVAMHNHGNFLYAYSDDAIDVIYEFFINEKTKTNIEKNYEVTKVIKEIFKKPSDEDNLIYMIRLSKFIWSIFGSSIQLEAKNMILHGAPGTGKTYSIKNTVKNIILKKGGSISEQLVFTQFHPSYSYEDFIDGIKPIGINKNGQMNFELKNGQFKELCRIATIKLIEERKNGKSTEDLTQFFFVADEINRAELSRVFGELLICLEDDYRIDFDKKGNILKEENLIITQNASLDNNPVYKKDDKNYFGVPININFIGTMNDIDRSVDSFDMALRRRFFWKEIRCSYNFIDTLFNNKDYTEICKSLNRYITGYKEDNKLTKIDNIGKYKSLNLGTSFDLGHAYFRISEVTNMNINKLWDSKIKPLLKEYLRAEYSQDEIGKKLLEAKKIFTLPKKENDDTNS
jgi:5-methylcytosine-specific restriction endonuclease McrBC GTP-binding regulatory subunit McrB